jgi:hypothetical protein
MVEVGDQDGTWGTITLTPDGLAYAGSDVATLQAVVVRWPARYPSLDDAALLAMLPQRMHSPYSWAVTVPDRSPHDAEGGA